MFFKKLSLFVIVLTLISCTPNSEMTIAGEVRDVSLSTKVIHLQEPVNGLTTIALVEGCELVGSDHKVITLQEVQPGMQINASGRQGGSNAMLANQVVVVQVQAHTTTLTETPNSIATQQDEANILDIDLSAQLEMPDHLPIGEEVNLKFTLTNTSDTPMYVLKWYTPLEGIAGEIFRVTFDGLPIPYEGILASRGSPAADEYILLRPDESTSTVVDLGTSFDFSKPGIYEIKFISPRISHIAFVEEEFAKSLDDLGPVQISSKSVTLMVGDE